MSSWVVEILEDQESYLIDSDKNGLLIRKLREILFAIVTKFLLIVIASSVKGKKNYKPKKP
jgi:hypothetical protein